MVVKTTERLITAEEFAQMPESRGAELIRGRIVWPGTTEEPVNNRLHAWMVYRLSVLLGSFVEPCQLGQLFAGDPGMIVERDPDTARGPEIAFIAKERAAQVPMRGYSELAADFVIEVLSPSDTMVRIQRKVRQLLAAGVKLVWVIDTDGQTVTEYRGPRDVRIYTLEDVLQCDDVLPGFRWPVKALFDAKVLPIYSQTTPQA